MQNGSAIGWAVIVDGKVKLRTVSDTRRAAIVNFLVTDRLTMIYSDATDQEIEREWCQLKGDAEVDYVTVARGVSH